MGSVFWVLVDPPGKKPRRGTLEPSERRAGCGQHSIVCEPLTYFIRCSSGYYLLPGDRDSDSGCLNMPRLLRFRVCPDGANVLLPPPPSPPWSTAAGNAPQSSCRASLGVCAGLWSCVFWEEERRPWRCFWSLLGLLGDRSSWAS